MPGEIGLWLRLAPITFVGRSLVPTGGRRPARRTGRPRGPPSSTVPTSARTGPISTTVASLGGARLVHDGQALGAAVSCASRTRQDRRPWAHVAWTESSRGAEGTDRLVDILMTALDDPGAF